MVTDNSKNHIYFSDLFSRDHLSLCQEIEEIATQANVKIEMLPYTKDYWCRDYMPIQVTKNRYIQFNYEPDYLKKKKQFVTDVNEVVEAHGIEEHVVKCPVVIDGGNMTICKGSEGKREYTSLIMIDKVLSENPSMSKEEIENEICKAAGDEHIKFVWLPWEGKNCDKYGHTDGMVRFYETGTNGLPSVITNLAPYGKNYADKIREILSEHFNVVELKFSENNKLNWAYMNYIQIDNLIIVPELGEKTDDEMMHQMLDLYEESIFTEYKRRIIQVQMRDLIKKWGGALNCLSGTVKK